MNVHAEAWTRSDGNSQNPGGRQDADETDYSLDGSRVDDAFLLPGWSAAVLILQ